MSRLKNYARGVLSGYAQLGASVVYSLVSIPLALAFLQKAEFGLWALLLPIMGYTVLIDLGMTSALSRLLVDHKDQRQDGTYGALVKTAFLVSSTQGVIIFGLLALLAPAIGALLRVPSGYESTFVALLRVQGAVSAFGFAARPFGLVLTANQRMDLCSYGDIFSLLLSLGWLWIFLSKGVGVFSFVYAAGINAVVIPIYLAWMCKTLRLLPHGGEWGRVTVKLFREVFAYGKDVFLVALGTQMVLASQMLIVSRRLGLEAAAAWAVGTKMFSLLLQLVSRTISVATPALSEMIARAEHERLRARFKGLVSLTASLSAFLGISFVLCNSVFVTIWTAGKITWSPLNDVLLAIWLCVLAVQGMHNNLVIATKQIQSLRYVFFLEGCTFLGLAILVGSRAGMPGLILTSILCTIAFSFSYGIWRSSRYFGCHMPVVAISWISPSIKVAITFGAISAIIWCATVWLPLIPRLIVNSFSAGVVGGLTFLRLGIPLEMRRELATRLPIGASRFLNYVVRCDLVPKGNV
jgi:O-antigen/teichoic acid export membrane protein